MKVKGAGNTTSYTRQATTKQRYVLLNYLRRPPNNRLRISNPWNIDLIIIELWKQYIVNEYEYSTVAFGFLVFVFQRFRIRLITYTSL